VKVKFFTGGCLRGRLYGLNYGSGWWQGFFKNPAMYSFEWVVFRNNAIFGQVLFESKTRVVFEEEGPATDDTFRGVVSTD